MATVVGADAIEALVQLLRSEGRTVIAPTVRDGTIVPAEITSTAELPVGLTDAQGPGRYRLVETGTPALFASSAPADGWKRHLHPPEALLVRSHRGEEGLVVEPVRPDVPSGAFVGIRSCDLAAIGVLDRVFLRPGAEDPVYAARRRDLFIVAVACSTPGDLCFCASMGTGPSPSAGFDLSLVELCDDARHEFVVQCGSERGEVLLERLEGRTAVVADLETAHAQHESASQAMGRTVDRAVARRAGAAVEHGGWLDVGDRCLACGNCTMVCPTCFCSRTSDRSDLAGVDAERWRSWDSCFGADFSSLHGTPVRAGTADRYRQWLLHKFVTWHDQFGTSGCVGCGRCISACPVGIDVTVELERMGTS